MAAGRRRANSDLDRTDKPQWLLDPPGSDPIAPPVSTRRQLLPFATLGWEDFERLCLRLAREDGAPEDWRIYGDRGQAQGGIDVLVRQSNSDRYVVWQAKRHQTFTAAKVRAAVKAFLTGEWADRTERFVLCSSASLQDTRVIQALEEGAQVLRERGVLLDARDPTRLSEQLKTLPEVVDDFFDRPWTEAFCGKEAVKILGDRLARADFARLRARLEKLYQAHFLTIDPGVLRASGVAQPPRAPLPLSVRFVPPDLLSVADATWSLASPPPVERAYGQEADHPGSGSPSSDERDVRSVRRSERRRIGLSAWSLEADRAVIVGAPGAGKSTLMRFLALDLLAPKPRLMALRERYPGSLPLWISFPFWTRQIQNQPPGSAISIQGVLSAWLRAHDAEDLVPLVQRAIQDRRVVLLVDGVDEWADETSATTAIGLLSTFVQAHGTPAIITSRPHGARVLGGLDDSWRRHELAPFDRTQQLEFALAWCEFLFGEAADGARHPARRQAEQFTAEIHRSPQIAPLAGTPLLLGGLLALVLGGGTLPDSRYRAYEEVTRRILEVHPQSRDQAALAARARDDLDPRTRERVLAALAFEIQRQPSPEAGLDAIKALAAEKFCRDFLVEALDLPLHLAGERARQLIAVGQEALGVLVQKSPTEVGFLHRAFQEFLAARHVASLDLDQQLALLSDHATDPRWREVILFVAQACDRQSDVERLVTALEAAVAASPDDSWSVDLLLAEIAFGDVRRSPATARRLAARLFAYVETGANHDQRLEILKLVIAGLTWEQSRALVSARLGAWIPDWHGPNRRDALRLIPDWTDERTAVDEVLWRNLHSDDASLRQQAATSFAKMYADQEEGLERLARLIADPPSVEVAASALGCLQAGWPEIPRAVAILEAAAASPVTGLALAGIAARVARGDRRDADRDRLLEAIDADEPFDDSVGDVLVAGWRGDPALKPVLLIDDPLWSFHRDRRLPIALRAFPQDDEVARALLKSTQKAHDSWLPFETWAPLRDHFKGHAIIGQAIDERVPTLAPQAYALSQLAGINPSDTVKAKLLDCLKSPDAGVGHLVDALVEHWGLGDVAVAAALRDAVDWPPACIAEVADRLPDLIGDKERCAGVLIDALKACVNDREGRLDHFFQALHQLGAPIPETIIQDLLQIDYTAGGEWVWVNACGLMGAFPERPEVVDLVKRLLVRPTGVVSGAASWLEAQPGMKTAVLAVSAPLPSTLRLAAIHLLADRAVDNPAAFDLLALAGLDSHAQTAGAALLAESRARLARDEVTTEFLDRLIGQFDGAEVAVGGRRIGAYAGLALLDRLDLLEERERVRPLDLGIFFPDESALPMQALAHAWPVLQPKIDVVRLGQLLRVGPAGLAEAMMPYADQSQQLAQFVREAVLDQVATGDRRASLLRYMARQPGLASRLIDACLAQLAAPTKTWPSQSAAYAAGEILGQDFSDSAFVLGRVLDLLGEGVPPGPVAALCEGWSDHPALETIFQRLVEDDKLAASLPTPLAMKIVATKSSAENFVASLVKAAEGMTGGVWDGIPHWLPLAVRRLRRNEGAATGLMEHLQDKPSAGAKVSFVSLLIQAQGLGPDLAAWCAAELDPRRLPAVAEAGMDLSLGQIVLVRQRLSQILRGERG